MPLMYTVPQSHCVIVERLGKFSQLHKQGLHFLVPVLDRVRHLDGWGSTANKEGYQIELSEQQTDTPPRQCHTKDNVPVRANASVYWKITDARRAVYEVDILPSAIIDVALNSLRTNIGTLDLDAVLAERSTINERIAVQLSETGRKWGVSFTRVEIQELTTDGDVAKSMVKQMDAERQRRADVASAHGRAEALGIVAKAESDAAIIRAEGEAIAQAKIAEGEAFYLRRLKEQVGDAEATQILIAQKYITGFETITKEASDKVFLPNSFQGLFSIPTGTTKKRTVSEDEE